VCATDAEGGEANGGTLRLLDHGDFIGVEAICS